MKHLFTLLEQHAIQRLRALDAKLDEKAASRVLEAHLNPAHFAMPIHSIGAEQRLINWSKGEEDLALATDILRFEETHTIRGIARVLARTHLNRQGVANVTRGAQWKAQSPRVLGVFDLAKDNADLRHWLEYTPLVEAFLGLAQRNHEPSTPAEARFDDEDIADLKALAQLTPLQARQMGAREVPGTRKPGWARVVLGFYTGLCYLDERFGFDAARIWAQLEAVTKAEEVDMLAEDARRHITEFGPRLAPSFFADLGCAGFVKADTHVSDVVRAAGQLEGQPSAQTCIDFVRQLADDTGRSPRAIDKLMYLACSGNFYLAGLAPPRGVARAGKEELLHHLRQLRPGVAG